MTFVFFDLRSLLLLTATLAGESHVGQGPLPNGVCLCSHGDLWGDIALHLLYSFHLGREAGLDVLDALFEIVQNFGKDGQLYLR